MPLKTSEAFVIDTRKLREADRLVTLFTEDEGKVKGVAASAARSRRRFGGALERLSRVRVTYFEREGGDLVRIDSCDLLDESFTLHQDLRVAATLAYVAEVTETFTHERESDPRYFRLLKSLMACLRGREPGRDPRVLARYFEVWTLRLHGLMPDLERCEACNRPLEGTGAVLGASGTAPAFCPACGPKEAWSQGGASGRAFRLSAPTLAALDSFRKLAPAEILKLDFPPNVMTEIETLASGMLAEFAGHPFRSSRFLRDCSPERAP